MKTIYFIRANKTKYGGAENYLSCLSEVLKKQNINHQVVNSIFPKFMPSWLRVILFNLQVCLTKKDKFYFSLDRITCPDIYRAGDGVHKVFLSIEKKSRTNLLHPIYLFLERKCFNKAKHIIANSQMVKNDIVSTYKINPKKISVIHNGIEIKKFNYQKSFDKLSNEFSIKKDQKILLYVGSGFKRKGVKEFLQIISKLRNLDIKAFVIGKEKDIEYYQELSLKLKIDDRVIFTGPREDVDDFYTISDIFLLPTHYEPFSNVVLEAMGFENAVFTTKQNGASEVLDSSFIMNNPSDFSIISAIEELFNNPSKLENIKKENRAKSEKFSIENNLKKTLEVINEVIN
ncbi:glycosyltransferase family 4 protein [archaeon]|jgi:UDP-glucose:(heptosyl)LPS alpha-1,3-glucosyltransferase|nr:glycosyltransferase family 4 protein [archaeon]